MAADLRYTAEFEVAEAKKNASSLRTEIRILTEKLFELQKAGANRSQLKPLTDRLKFLTLQMKDLRQEINGTDGIMGAFNSQMGRMVSVIGIVTGVTKLAKAAFEEMKNESAEFGSQVKEVSSAWDKFSASVGAVLGDLAANTGILDAYTTGFENMARVMRSETIPAWQKLATLLTGNSLIALGVVEPDEKTDIDTAADKRNKELKKIQEEVEALKEESKRLDEIAKKQDAFFAQQNENVNLAAEARRNAIDSIDDSLNALQDQNREEQLSIRLAIEKWELAVNQTAALNEFLESKRKEVELERELRNIPSGVRGGVTQEQIDEEERRLDQEKKMRDALTAIASDFTDLIAQGLVNSGRGFRRAMIAAANAFLVKLISSGILSLITQQPTGLFGQIFSGFASGGYTGYGGKYQPRGFVHAAEYVAPKRVVANPASFGAIQNLESIRKRGMADGGPSTPLPTQQGITISPEFRVFLDSLELTRGIKDFGEPALVRTKLGSTT